MKKYAPFISLILLFAACTNPVGRSWIIPVNIDPTDLHYTPSDMESFEQRRNQILDSISEGYVILASTDQSSFNRHEFRPNNNFYYLTGYSGSRSYLILDAASEGAFTLTLPPQSIRSMIYEGSHLPQDQIKAQYRPDKLLSYQQFRGFLDSLLQTSTILYLDHTDRRFYEEVLQKTSGTKALKIVDISGILDEMRVIKDPMEVERLQKACNITAKSLINVMKECVPGRYEFEMESIIEGTFLQYGSAMPGFNSIVGSGPNSTILHYDANSRMMEDGDLLLMDIGAEYGFYTADITRTIPVNGRFSQEQTVIYQLVLDAQLAAIDQMIPGNKFMDGHMAAKDIIVEGLHQLGLITDPKSPWQIKFYILYPSSHFLGLDVHDVGDKGGSFAQFMQQTPQETIESALLEPGMVLTIEPGLYFREKGLEQLYEIFGNEADSSEIDTFIKQVGPVYEKYLNIGIRIEDDILITQEGNINLSRYAPKQMEDIEQLMR